MSVQPHVLFVAWGFPPSRGGGVYRALAIANGFARQGARVTVLTAGKETFERFTGTDESLMTQVDPSVRVIRVPFDWPTYETDLRSWSLLRVLSPRLWQKLRNRRDQLPFPELAYGPWRTRLEAAAERVHAEQPVDLVVATANPNVDLVAAAHLWQKHRVPYVVDYRDAWLLDVFTGAQNKSDDSRAARWERHLFQHAREIWFVNEPIKAWHARRYPWLADRMHVVANGYDPDYAPDPRLMPQSADRGLRFGYIGTVSTKVPMKEFAAGWRLAQDEGLVDSRDTAEVWGYLGFYSTPDERLAQIFKNNEDVGLRYAGPLPKTRVREVYESFDVLLLILGAGRYVTSGKVFEYVSSALPIVSVHDPGNAASEILREYPLWFPAEDLTPEAISEALARAGEAARGTGPAIRAACVEFAEQYSRERQLGPRVDSLLSSVPGQAGVA